MTNFAATLLNFLNYLGKVIANSPNTNLFKYVFCLFVFICWHHFSLNCSWFFGKLMHLLSENIMFVLTNIVHKLKCLCLVYVCKSNTVSYISWYQESCLCWRLAVFTEHLNALQYTESLNASAEARPPTQVPPWLSLPTYPSMMSRSRSPGLCCRAIKSHYSAQKGQGHSILLLFFQPTGSHHSPLFKWEGVHSVIESVKLS